MINSIRAILTLAAVVGTTLFTTGCVDLVEKDDLEKVSTRVEKLSVQVAQKNDMQALLYEELVKRANGLEKKIGEMDIMVNTMKAQVARLEDRERTMQGQIDALGIEHLHSSAAKRVSVSIGAVETAPTADTHRRQALELADRLLYEAKQGGRNRVAIAPPDGSTDE